MRRGKDSPAWRVSIGDRRAMTGALWLRDASGLAVDLDPPIPPLDPAVPLRPDLAALASRQAAAQWTGMWLGLWEGRLDDWWAVRMLQPPGFELLSQSPQLRALTEAGFEDASQWVAAHRPTRRRRGTRPGPAGLPGLPGRSDAAVGTALMPDVGEVVRELEKERQRKAGAFELDVTVLPVAGRVFWLPFEGWLVVSERLLLDRRAFRALLYDVLGAMV